VEYGWDDAKHARNLRERGIGFDDGALIFEGPVVEWIDDRRDYGEVRIRAVGWSDGDVLHVVYTQRGEVRRIISVRLASRKERQKWRSRA
jgi:uncharacterized DUF497 family protein